MKTFENKTRILVENVSDVLDAIDYKSRIMDEIKESGDMVELDFSEVRNLNIEMIGFLLSIHKVCKKHKKQLTIIGCKEEIQDLFDEILLFTQVNYN